MATRVPAARCSPTTAGSRPTTPATSTRRATCSSTAGSTTSSWPRHPGAAATESELQDWVRSQLRSTKTPERIQFRDELPCNETGKLLRRVLKSDLAA